VSVGDLYRTARGWAVTAPTHCPDGHRMGPGQVLVGNQPCGGGAHPGSHLTWTCRECGATAYHPPLGSACRILHGGAGVRNV
jgi:hypothetical protein